MLGTPRLLGFSLRALVLVVAIGLLWTFVAGPYSGFLAALAGPLVSSDTALKAVDTRIQINHPSFAEPIAIRGLVLHYGLILTSVLVLAVGGISAGTRLRWLLSLGVAGVALHAAAVALVARGLIWASDPASPEGGALVVLRLFAVFWSLLPAAMGAAWIVVYWVPRVRRPRVEPGDSVEG